MPLDASEISDVTLLLSAERLAALNQLTGSPSAAIELHQETLSVGASLMNLTATIEIALRNAVCENLGQHFAVPDWLFNPPHSFAWRDMEHRNIIKARDSARRAKYSKLSQAEKGALDALAYPRGRPPGISHHRRTIDRRGYILVSNGSIIAEFTFHFWKRIYGPDYDQALWRTTLKRTFPNRTISRATVAERLEEIYQSRNRLAHHEPVLHSRFNNTMRSIKFVIENLGTQNPMPDSPLAKLIADDILDVKAKADALHARLDSYRVASV